MSMRKQQKEKGFTIIEVVLVLAIAGLIFMMVFIALPALQRSQRDTQRKNDLSRAITAIENYTSNNNGDLPSDSDLADGTFTSSYLTSGSDKFTDPSADTGTSYTFKSSTNADTTDLTDTGVIYFTKKAICNGTSVTIGQSNRKIALRMKLEAGTTCENN